MSQPNKLACSLLLAAAFLAAPFQAGAVPVRVDASFQENFLGGGGDTLSSVSAQGGVGITRIRYDLSGSDAFFDPGDAPFTVVNEGGTGFDGMFNATDTTLVLNFSDFDPGEMFVFSVDVDDGFGFTFGFEFAGTLIEVTFDAAAPNVASDLFRSAGRLGRATASVVADVNVSEPLAATLLLLGLTGIGVWSRRGRRTTA